MGLQQGRQPLQFPVRSRGPLPQSILPSPIPAGFAPQEDRSLGLGMSPALRGMFLHNPQEPYGNQEKIAKSSPPRYKSRGRLGKLSK